MTKVLVLYYSTYGHIETMAKAVAEGAEVLAEVRKEWERLPDAYYVKALTIDADIGHKGEAKRAYEQVINQFPDHPYAQDARALIANLEYSDEELIRRFQQMEKEGEDPEAAR